MIRRVYGRDAPLSGCQTMSGDPNFVLTMERRPTDVYDDHLELGRGLASDSDTGPRLRDIQCLPGTGEWHQQRGASGQFLGARGLHQGRMNRRKFLVGLLAAASPLPSLPVSMRFTSYGSGAEYIVRGATLEEIRNELLPGLFDVRGKYETIPRQWETVFKTDEMQDAFDDMFEDVFDEKDKT